MNEKVLFYTGILFSIFVVIKILSFYSNDERYVPNDPEKKEFGHKPRMKFISKLTCGQVTARLWTDSYGPFDCRFGKEGDNYTFTINKMICMGGAPGRATYKPKIPTNYTQVYDEISTNKQFISDILQK